VDAEILDGGALDEIADIESSGGRFGLVAEDPDIIEIEPP